MEAFEQAIGIWSELKQTGPKKIQEKADEFLPAAGRQKAIHQAKSIREQNTTGDAINWLLQQQLEIGVHEDFEQAIKELLTEELDQHEGDDSAYRDPELKEHYLQLKVNEKFVDFLEAKLEAKQNEAIATAST